MTGVCSVECLSQLIELGFTPDKSRQAAIGEGLKPGNGDGSQQLVRLHGRRQSPDEHRAERLGQHIAFRELIGPGRDKNGPRYGHLLHPGRQMSSLAMGGIIRVEFASERAHENLARVQADANLKRKAFGPTHFVGVPLD